MSDSKTTVLTNSSTTRKNLIPSNFLIVLSIVAMLLPAFFPGASFFITVHATQNTFWSSIFVGAIVGIAAMTTILLMTWRVFYDKLCELKQHPVLTSIILLSCGICLLEFCYLTLHPIFMVASYKIAGINQKYIFKAPHFFINKLGITPTLSILLAPYFYVLWIWRHNNTERQVARENIQDNLNHFNSLVGQFSSSSEAIQITAAQGIERFLDNLPNNDPNLEYFYQQAITLFAEPVLYKDKDGNSYRKKVTGILENMQSQFSERTAQNKTRKYAESKSDISIFTSDQNILTNGYILAKESFNKGIKEFVHCSFEVECGSDFFSEVESANAQGLCKIIPLEMLIQFFENVDRFSDCVVELKLSKKLDLTNIDNYSMLENYISRINSFNGIECIKPKEMNAVLRSQE